MQRSEQDRAPAWSEVCDRNRRIQAGDKERALSKGASVVVTAAAAVAKRRQKQ